MARPDNRRQTMSATAEGIKAWILENQLKPGDLLPTESVLCEDLGVSRSSVREAVRTLASLDIVEVRHGHGTYVGGLSLSPLVNGLIFRSTLNTDRTFKTLREVVDIRIALDLAQTDDLVAVFEGTTNEELDQLVEGMRARRSARESFIEEDRDFHTRLLRDVDNAIVRELVGAFWEVHTAVVPMLGIPPAADIDQTVEAHGDMLKALEKGDADAYRKAVIAHYAPLQRAIETALSAPPVR